MCLTVSTGGIVREIVRYGMPEPSERADQRLATVLRTMREDRGLTREHVAYNAQLTTASLAKIELGQSSPAWATVVRIARALETTMAEIAELVERQS
jgi:DNA-binding XRE family transcriptional regulator